MKKVLIISQAITQTYYDLLLKSLHDCEVAIVTGSDIVAERIIKSPPHNPASMKSRLVCWKKHYEYISNWMKKNKNINIDLVFATSNPPINSYIGLKIAKYYRCKFVYMNWDLYPQVIEGAFNNLFVKSICRLWRYWNNKNYPRIDRMLTLGEGMAESIVEQMTSPFPIEVIPLGVNVDYLRPINKNDNKFCIDYGFTRKFIVLYSGKMGRGHNIEMILNAASLLENYPDILFLFIGNGEKRKTVETYISERNNKNVVIMDMQSDEMFPYSQASGDLCIVSQEKEMAKLFMPSKAYSSLACGQGIIGLCSENDDLGKLISRYSIGEIISSEKSEELANCILYYYNHNNELCDLGKRARSIAEEYFSLTIVSQTYKEMFEKIL